VSDAFWTLVTLFVIVLCIAFWTYMVLSDPRE
jgi:hypothetical protein